MGLSEEFNTWQSGYTEKILRWVPHYQNLLGAVVEALPPDFFPERVLDLGCGNGNGTALLLEHFPQAAITLLDASDEMLDACRSRFSDRRDCQFIQALFQDAEFSAGSFDLVIAVLALHHLPGVEKQQMFGKLRQWLRPGGILVYSDLFASKQNPLYRDTVIADWEAWAKSQGTPAEEWTYLMDHHTAYDYPDTYSNTLQWLGEAGFPNARIHWQEGEWGNLLAIRED